VDAWTRVKEKGAQVSQKNLAIHVWGVERKQKQDKKKKKSCAVGDELNNAYAIF